MAESRDGLPVKASLLLAAGTFVVGAVAPLYDTYVPALLERHLGRSAWVGAAMGIDNVLALLLVPVVGALSDGARFRGGRRVPFVLAALPFVVIGLALLPAAERVGLVALLGAMILLDAALAVWRAPFSALLAELIPSGQRSKTEGIQGVAMCLGAMVVLGAARPLAAAGPDRPFVLAAALAGVVWLIHLAWLREPVHAAVGGEAGAANPLASLRAAFAAGGSLTPRFFAACLLFHMAFQSFSSWFTLHGSERFHTSVADVSIGFIAVAIATLVGSLPAGWLGARYGRRRVALAGIAGMAVSCLLLQVAPSLSLVTALLFCFGLAWSLPTANLLPMALELGPPNRAGSLAGAFLLVQSVAGVIGPALIGGWFDLRGSKASLFLALVGFLAGALVLLAGLRPGFGEADGAGIRPVAG